MTVNNCNTFRMLTEKAYKILFFRITKITIVIFIHWLH